MYRDDTSDPPTIVCQVGGTKLLYDARAIEELHAMLVAHGDWMALGGTDEQKTAPEGTVEAWARIRQTIRAAAGTASSGASAAGSASTCRHCSRSSGWPRSPTTPRAIGCARSG